MNPPRLLLLSLFALATAACGSDPEPDAALTAAIAAAVAPAPPVATAPTHPDSEEAVVSAFADAADRRDLAAMQALCSAELGADLHQHHRRNDARFWAQER